MGYMIDTISHKEYFNNGRENCLIFDQTRRPMCAYVKSVENVNVNYFFKVLNEASSDDSFRISVFIIKCRAFISERNARCVMSILNSIETRVFGYLFKCLKSFLMVYDRVT